MKKFINILFYIGIIFITFITIDNLNVKSNDITAQSAYSFYAKKNTPYYNSYNSKRPIGYFKDYNHNVVTYYNPRNNRFRVNTNNSPIYVNRKDLRDHIKNFNDNYGYQHYTRSYLRTINNSIKQKSNQAPNLQKTKFQDVLSAKDNNGNQLNVWDSWPLQDANGNEITYKGYHIVFGLTGDENSSNIYVFYQKIGNENQGINSWKNAGPLFENVHEGNSNDVVINKEHQQWSGQTVKMSDGSIRLFYTSYNQKNSLGNDENLATAKINIGKNNNGIYVNHEKTSDRRNIFSSDGNSYQNASQVFTTSQYDEFGLRDPHYLEINRHKYLIFESDVGDKYGYQGRNSLHNLANYGGNKKFQNNEQNFLSKDQNIRWAEFAANANGAVGMIELDNNYKLKKIMKPLIGFNTVDDQIERPNLFEHNGKWYLFITTRGSKIALNNIDKNETYMLGFSSDNPMGPFKPLNKDGLVLASNKNGRNMYSYLLLNNKNSNNFIVTQYMVNPSSGKQTFGKSLLLNINGNATKILSNKIMPQGAVSKNNIQYYK